MDKSNCNSLKDNNKDNYITPLSNTGGVFCLVLYLSYMIFIITETQEKKIYLLRRLPEFEKYLKKIMKDDHPCDYESADDYANILIESAILETFDLTWDDYNSLLDDFEFKKVIIDKYHDELVKKYNKEKCDK